MDERRSSLGTKDGRPRVAVLYPGQGAQYPGMARSLYESEPAFREAFDRCAELCEPPVAELAFESDKAALDRTDATQPAIFVVEYALTELLASWGVRPSIVLGHSIGEYAAACAAGMLTLEDACRLICARGRLMLEHCRPGVLAAVNAPDESLQLLLAKHPDVEVALRNATASTVVGGTHEAMQRFVLAAGAAGATARTLAVSHAFHTRLMDPMLEHFAPLTESLRESVASTTFVSSVTGSEIDRVGGSYWVEHIRRPVLFGDALHSLARHSPDVIVEAGPGRTLTWLAQRELGKQAAGSWIGLLASKHDERGAIERAMEQLRRAGHIPNA